MERELKERLRRLPKAELHLHLEGALTPGDLLALARRNGCAQRLPDLAAYRRLYGFRDFPGFIQAIKTASQHLVRPGDYGWAVRRMGRRLAAQGIVYAEVFVSIGILQWKQMPVDPVWAAIEQARRDLEARRGLRLAWLFDAVRQFGAEQAERVVDEAIRLRKRGPVAGIGIGGDERAGPAAWFEASYARARAAGLGLTAHAGETAGAESVWAAAEQLRVDRIGHGLAAADDPALLAGLAAQGQQIDVCTISNRRTGCGDSGGHHPVQIFDKYGIRWSPGSDDPGIFRTSLLAEIYECKTRWGLGWPSLRRALRQGFGGAFLPEPEKEAYLRRLDCAWAELGLPGG